MMTGIKIAALAALITAAGLLFGQPARAACTDPAGVAGVIVYNEDHDVFQGCTGRGWIAFHSSGDATPDAFSFTDQTGVATSTVIESNIVTITGIDTGISVSITGDGSPEYRICDDASCSTVDHAYGSAAGSIDEGQYLQLRLTSNAANSTMNSATVTVGTQSDQWDVTTGSGGPAGCDNIGDACDDGSIFAGDGNMYVTDANQSLNAQWKNATGTDDIDPDSDTDGQANHDNRAGTLADFEAFQICETLDRHGHTDWYLPAKDELDTLYQNKVVIDANAAESFTTSRYWSSTEYSTTSYAWSQNFGNGSQNGSTKTTTYDVRCVRRG